MDGELTDKHFLLITDGLIEREEGGETGRWVDREGRGKRDRQMG